MTTTAQHANATVGAGTASLIPRADLFGNPERTSPTISPDGGWLAWIAPHDGVLNVWVQQVGADDQALTALGKAAVLVPLASSAGNEQAHNARHLADAGAAVALPVGATADTLREAVSPLLTDAAVRAVMADAARAQGRADAADRLVDVVLDAASV